MTQLTFEHQFVQQGYSVVAGLDEAGRGALAGPVAAGAAVLPLERNDLQNELSGVRDSKRLTAKQRDQLYDVITHCALGWAVGLAAAEEIDVLGIAPATRLAMQRAIMALDPSPQALIIDWVKLSEVDLPQISVKKGEEKSLSVAAASILAKVTRDRWMVEQADCLYPDYGFEGHKGYGTASHRHVIVEKGPCPLHRKTFEPIRSLLEGST